MERDPTLTLLTNREYCELRRIEPESARTERFRKLGPRYIRTGTTDRGRVLYRLADVLECLHTLLKEDIAIERAG